MSKCKVTRNSCKKEHLDKKLFGEQLQGTIFYLHTNCQAVDVDYNIDDDAAAKKEKDEKIGLKISLAEGMLVWDFSFKP